MVWEEFYAAMNAATSRMYVTGSFGGSATFCFLERREANRFVLALKAFDPPKKQKVLHTLRKDIMLAGKVSAKRMKLPGILPDEPDGIEYWVQWKFPIAHDVNDFRGAIRYLERKAKKHGKSA